MTACPLWGLSSVLSVISNKDIIQVLHELLKGKLDSRIDMNGNSQDMKTQWGYRNISSTQKGSASHSNIQISECLHILPFFFHFVSRDSTSGCLKATFGQNTGKRKRPLLQYSSISLNWKWRVPSTDMSVLPQENMKLSLAASKALQYGKQEAAVMQIS